jgi:hypothetical protein
MTTTLVLTLEGEPNNEAHLRISRVQVLKLAMALAVAMILSVTLMGTAGAAHNPGKKHPVIPGYLECTATTWHLLEAKSFYNNSYPGRGVDVDIYALYDTHGFGYCGEMEVTGDVYGALDTGIAFLDLFGDSHAGTHLYTPCGSNTCRPNQIVAGTSCGSAEVSWVETVSPYYQIQADTSNYCPT